MLRVIIVDDEPMSIKRFSGILKKTGLTILVGTYTDPEEALENAVSDHADVAFIDIEMPGMNGLTLTEKLQEKNSVLEVIMVTAHDHYALEAFRAHAVGYLLKPASLADVTRQLNILETKRAGQREKPLRDILHINTFGRFQCYTGKDDPDFFLWRTAKARELAAFLHHHLGNPVTRDTVLDTLWPEMDLDRGIKNFHATSYYLRESLKERNLGHLFERINGAYRLKWNEINSDEKQFLNASRKMDQGIAGWEELELITSIYTGHYCEEDDYTWAEEKRFQYERIFQKALNSLIDLQIKKGDRVSSANSLRRFIQLDPYNEAAHERLIDFFLENGDRPAARAHYNQMKELFLNELGVEPSKHLTLKSGI
ncbi:MAG: response regulator [Bacillota bacterium]|nr:response regulator [Bacillota bacterium]MDW7676327.1 response regulator [Bacillota bacterium]